MKYLCLGYFSPEKMDALPPGELSVLMAGCQGPLEALAATGKLVTDIGVETEMVGIRRVDGAIVVSPGSGPRGADTVGSAFVVEATGWDEAVRLASLHPTIHVARGETLGWRLEVRPVHTFRPAQW